MSSKYKQSVVIDTNVFVSGLVFGGAPRRIIEAFVDNDIIVVSSEELLRELRRVIAQKFPLYASMLDLLELSIRFDATMVQLGDEPITASRDPDDNKFIEAALAGNASWIISGDKDLLDVERYKTIQIVTPVEFLKAL